VVHRIRFLRPLKLNFQSHVTHHSLLLITEELSVVGVGGLGAQARLSQKQRLLDSRCVPATIISLPVGAPAGSRCRSYRRPHFTKPFASVNAPSKCNLQNYPGKLLSPRLCIDYLRSARGANSAWDHYFLEPSANRDQYGTVELANSLWRFGDAPGRYRPLRQNSVSSCAGVLSTLSDIAQIVGEVRELSADFGAIAAAPAHSALYFSVSPPTAGRLQSVSDAPSSKGANLPQKGYLWLKICITL